MWARLGLGPLLGSWATLFAVRLLAVTLITYLMMSTDARLGEISDVLQSYELVATGAAALLFWLLWRLQLSTSQPWAPVKELTQGGILGLQISLALVAAWWMTGHLKPSGLYTADDQLGWIYLGLALRAAALGLWLTIDEWFYRGWLQPRLLSVLPGGFPPAMIPLIVAAVSLLPKWVQLDLGWRQMASLLIFYTWLGLSALRGQPVQRGAGLALGLHTGWHLLCGLPLLGVEPVQAQAFQAADLAHPWVLGPQADPWASPVVTILLGVAVGTEVLRQKKSLWARPSLS